MSKKRPRVLHAETEAAGPALSRFEVDFWRKRLFKNSYSWEGKLRRTRQWCVKIQHELRRKTFPLLASHETDAAREALEIYRNLIQFGWEHVREKFLSRRSIPEVMEQSRLEDDAAYWKPRLIHRPYTEGMNSKLTKELSVRIQWEETGFYFPLGTDQLEAAAARAREIHQQVRRDGWEKVLAQHPREITVAVFWSNNPLVYTYATFLSIAGPAPNAPQDFPGLAVPLQVAVVEPDSGVRQAFQFWVLQKPYFQCAGLFSRLDEARRALAHRKPDCLLISRSLDDDPQSSSSIETVKRQMGRRPVYRYGVYEDSDQVYYSFSGVSAGYMMRRRPPSDLLEPLASAPRPFNGTAANQSVRNYFQNLFSYSPTAKEDRPISLLTVRELQIMDLVSKGYLDKEIAGRLSISPWTVHAHLRNVYEKMGVHNRTEAVVKYLQK